MPHWLQVTLLTPVFLIGAGSLGTWMNPHRRHNTKEPKK